jgi:hypothetical protein
VAKAKSKLGGKATQAVGPPAGHLVGLHQAGQHTIAELAELFCPGRRCTGSSNAPAQPALA